MSSEDLILDALQAPPSALSYYVSQRLAETHPDLALVEGSACGLDPVGFAAAGLCSLSFKAAIHAQVVTNWLGEDSGLEREPHNVWLEVTWQGYSLSLVLMHWIEGFHERSYCWILAETSHVAEDFYETLSEWSAVLRAEVLVFKGGQWHKDNDLYKSIQDSTFDNLVLPGVLKNEIAADVAQFFAAEERYARYRVPWKRGLLFVGPPGNGKTHAVKAVINALGKPCVYVRSFQTNAYSSSTPGDAIAELFQRVRKLAPCVLVLEDLDSLIDDTTRAFLLNELDGLRAMPAC